MLKCANVKIGSKTRSQGDDQGWVIQGLPGHCRKFRAKQRSKKWGTKNVLIHIVTHVCTLSHSVVYNSATPRIHIVTHVCTLSHSVVYNSATPRIVDCQIPLPVGLLKQEYWSGLSSPSPGDLKPVSPTSSFVSRHSLPLCLLESPVYSLSRYSTGTLIDFRFPMVSNKSTKSLVSLSLQFRE